jgi:hypothetical protein
MKARQKPCFFIGKNKAAGLSAEIKKPSKKS